MAYKTKTQKKRALESIHSKAVKLRMSINSPISHADYEKIRVVVDKAMKKL